MIGLIVVLSAVIAVVVVVVVAADGNVNNNSNNGASSSSSLRMRRGRRAQQWQRQSQWLSSVTVRVKQPPPPPTTAEEEETAPDDDDYYDYYYDNDSGNGNNPHHGSDHESDHHHENNNNNYNNNNNINYHCGCMECNDSVWNRIADGHTYGDRIMWVRENNNNNNPHSPPAGTGTDDERLRSACSWVAGREFPRVCGTCDPDRCQLHRPHQPQQHQNHQPQQQQQWSNYEDAFRQQQLPLANNNNNHPLFGPNVIIFDPVTSTARDIQKTFDDIFERQENDEMGSNRYALLFKPGVYGSTQHPLLLNVGYYTEVAGLGANPNDVVIYGKIQVLNRCFDSTLYKDGLFVPTTRAENRDCLALNSFWRSLSNLSVKIIGQPNEDDDCRKTAMFWAISQASSMRRVHISGGTLSLMDYCTHPAYASGGYIGDTLVTGGGKVISGSQQQFFTRNSEITGNGGGGGGGGWDGAVWNQFFLGVVGAPDDSSYPDPPYTTIETNPLSREKPFLFLMRNNDDGDGDGDGDEKYWWIRVPSARRNTRGISWRKNGGGLGADYGGRSEPLSSFFVAYPNRQHSNNVVDEINMALRNGMNLLLTPGVYDIPESIVVNNPGTVVLGLGLATLTSSNGSIPLVLADVPGIIVAGITIDAGEIYSPVLLQVGEEQPPIPPEEQQQASSSNNNNNRNRNGSGGGGGGDDDDDPITLSDVYFRLGGPHVGRAGVCLQVNSDNVLVDHTWIWRADHGVENFDPRDGFDGDNQRWKTNTGQNGIVVNGNDVTVTGLFVEHFQEHNVVWNGEGGRVFFFQSELAYDPQSQQDWMSSDGKMGWAAYKVNGSVQTHELWGAGAYSYNRNNPSIVTESGFDLPRNAPGVEAHRLYTRNLSGPGTIRHIINDQGPAVTDADKGPYYILSY